MGPKIVGGGVALGSRARLDILCAVDAGIFEAIHEAGIRRFRPIMLTTLTTFGGLTPIILVIVPCLYMVLEDLLKMVGMKRRAPSGLLVGDADHQHGRRG